MNAAFDLLAQGCAPALAASMLTDAYGLSRRQASRYVQEARAIDRPVVAKPPCVAITVKVPEDVASQLRAHALATDSTIGDVVARAVRGLIAREHRRA